MFLSLVCFSSPHTSCEKSHTAEEGKVKARYPSSLFCQEWLSSSYSVSKLLSALRPVELCVGYPACPVPGSQQQSGHADSGFSKQLKQPQPLWSFLGSWEAWNGQQHLPEVSWHWNWQPTAKMFGDGKPLLNQLHCQRWRSRGLEEGLADRGKKVCK